MERSLLNLTNLNHNYATTKLCYKLIDDKYLNEQGKIKEDYKFKLNFPEFGIVDSKIPAKKDEKFDTLLFLPKGEKRKGEGGLRTKGYFKFSYKKFDNNWYIVDSEGKQIKKIKLPNNINLSSTNIYYLPLITIVTVVYNSEKYIEETIKSVINQTYPNVEYIIIDGGSTDRTIDIIKKYEDYIDYWVSERDCCMYDAMNKGLKLAFGDYLSFLNSDDRIASLELLNNLLTKFNKNNVDIIYGRVNEIHQNFIKEEKLFRIDFEDLLFSKQCTFMPQPATYLKKTLIKQVGFFDLNFKYASDYDYALRALEKTNNVVYIDDVFTLFRIHPGSITSSGKLNEDVKSILKKHGYFKRNKFRRNLKYAKLWLKYSFLNFINILFPKRAKYIVRLDDACPTMDYNKWKKIEEILDYFNIKPIVAVIPDNKDSRFNYNYVKNFWQIVKNWENKGWYIALHGFNHVSLTKKGGIVPINFCSEFSGLPLSEQEEKIEKGFKILKEKGLTPTVWVAPFHSFDENTLLAIKNKTDIRIISDGFFRYPCYDDYFKWIPQQLWSFKEKRNGIYTICLHPNEMNETDFMKMKKFLQRNSSMFIKLEAIVYEGKCRKGFYFYSSLLLVYLKKLIRKVLK